MNAQPRKLTAAGIALAITGASRPTLADFYAWGWPERRRVVSPAHVKLAFGYERTDDLDAFRRGVIVRIEREERKRDAGHWSFDANRFAWMNELLDAIDAFHADQIRRAA